ncbi:MAG: HAD family phosphatase [Clostridia bacterium]|nr:HAD family phosphatase [Clostridia bacterium]
MKRIKGILFDFNGTLFFDSEMHAQAFGLTCDAYGVERFTREQLISGIFGRTNAKIYRDNFQSDATDEECERFSTVKKNFYFESCLAQPDRLTLAPGAAEMLDYLKEQGIPMALATGSDREEVDFFIEHLGISRWFSYEKNVVYNDGSFSGKPAPDCYILAARKIGLDPSECAVFEDGRSGIMAANAAGCAAVIAVHEEGIPSPLGDGCEANALYHDHTKWRETLTLLGLYGKD